MYDYTALKKVIKAFTPTTDLRGKHPQSQAITDHQTELVREHIMSLPTVSNHYTRAKSPHRHYLASDLSIECLYNMYLFWIEKEHPAGCNKRVKAS